MAKAQSSRKPRFFEALPSLIPEFRQVKVSRGDSKKRKNLNLDKIPIYEESSAEKELFESRAIDFLKNIYIESPS